MTFRVLMACLCSCAVLPATQADDVSGRTRTAKLRKSAFHLAGHPADRGNEREQLARQLEELELKKQKVVGERDHADSDYKRRVLGQIVQKIEEMQTELRRKMKTLEGRHHREVEADRERSEQHHRDDRRRPEQIDDHHDPVDHHVRRLRALREAGERLEHGGVHDIAKALFRQADELEREIDQHRSVDGGDRDEIVHELIHGMHELREEVHGLHNKLDEILEFIEEVREGEFDEEETIEARDAD